jgi:hypothetical protein
MVRTPTARKPDTADGKPSRPSAQRRLTMQLNIPNLSRLDEI